MAASDGLCSGLDLGTAVGGGIAGSAFCGVLESGGLYRQGGSGFEGLDDLIAKSELRNPVLWGAATGDFPPYPE